MTIQIVETEEQKNVPSGAGVASAPLIDADRERVLLLSLAVTGLLGLLLRARAEAVFGRPLWAAVFLVANGLFLLATAWCLRRGSVQKLDIASLSWWHYVVIGAAQGLAVVPGLSRFGLTLIVGLLCGLGWYQALKLSFLLSLPTVLAATALELYEAPPGLDAQVLLPLASAMIVAGVGAFAAIRLIRREALHAPRALANFGFYCVAAGLFYSLYVYWLG